MIALALPLPQLCSVAWRARPMPHDPAEKLLARLDRIVRRAVPAWLREQSDDLVQQAHLRVLPRVQAGQELRPAYLHRVAHSVIMDAMRQRRTHPEDPADDTEVEATPAPAVTPEDAAGGTEVGAAIRTCLDQAKPPVRRRLLTLYLLGHSVPESARMLSLKRKQVENHVYRGLARLRECLRALGVTP